MRSGFDFHPIVIPSADRSRQREAAFGTVSCERMASFKGTPFFFFCIAVNVGRSLKHLRFWDCRSGRWASLVQGNSAGSCLSSQNTFFSLRRVTFRLFSLFKKSRNLAPQTAAEVVCMNMLHNPGATRVPLSVMWSQDRSGTSAAATWVVGRIHTDKSKKSFS